MLHDARVCCRITRLLNAIVSCNQTQSKTLVQKQLLAMQSQVNAQQRITIRERRKPPTFNIRLVFLHHSTIGAKQPMQRQQGTHCRAHSHRCRKQPIDDNTKKSVICAVSLRSTRPSSLGCIDAHNLCSVTRSNHSKTHKRPKLDAYADDCQDKMVTTNPMKQRSAWRQERTGTPVAI